MNWHAAVALGASVALHVVWNLAARRSSPESAFLWWGILGYLVLVTPWGVPALVATGLWADGVLLGCLALSGLALTLYFLALSQAYRHAPVNLVYPLTRGIPVLLVAAGAMPLYGEHPETAGWWGMLLAVTGLGLLALTGRRGASAPAQPFVLAAAQGTTVYTLSDRGAVVRLPGLAAQLGYVAVVFMPVVVGLTGLNRLRLGRSIPPRRPPAVAWLGGGLCIGISYALVIHVMALIPAAHAVAFTNLGILLMAVVSLRWRSEREQVLARGLAVAVAAAGLAVLAWSRAG